MQRWPEPDVCFDCSYHIDARSGCWLWLGIKGSRQAPYGYMCMNGLRLAAHRYAWERFNGRSIPPGFYVCHHCDVPHCVNPKHLFLGTALDNERDKIAKGRRPRANHYGEGNPSARLTLDEVRAILADRRVQKVIAQDYGVSRGTVAMIKAGHNWRVALQGAAE